MIRKRKLIKRLIIILDKNFDLKITCKIVFKKMDFAEKRKIYSIYEYMALLYKLQIDLNFHILLLEGCLYIPQGKGM